MRFEEVYGDWQEKRLTQADDGAAPGQITDAIRPAFYWMLRAGVGQQLRVGAIREIPVAQTARCRSRRCRTVGDSGMSTSGLGTAEGTSVRTTSRLAT
ncbi:Uncharacterised protein [Burkholderia pseudomallei]|nr:Uncharacterised protein [Burkholderia pseudomallei]